MTYRLAVDLGTAYAAAAVSNGLPPAMVGLGNRAMQVPSVIFVDANGTVQFGEAAERRGMTEPSRVVREFKRRLGDPVPILVAGAAYSAESLMARQLRWIVELAEARQGERPTTVVLTHPANWGPYKLELFDQVVKLADVGPVVHCTEPEAAAAQYASRERVEPGDRIAVYDLGGGTFDICILEKTAAGFQLLGSPDGIEHLGGVDFDEALTRLVTGALGQRLSALDIEDPAVTVGLARLRRDCVEAKEALSSEVEVTVPVALPGLITSIRVTRGELEDAMRPAVGETITAVHRALRSAGLQPGQLRSIVLVGGSSRIPLVGEMLQHAFRVPIAVDTHPKHDVVLGASRLLLAPPIAVLPTAVAPTAVPSAAGMSTAVPAAAGPLAGRGGGARRRRRIAVTLGGVALALILGVVVVLNLPSLNTQAHGGPLGGTGTGGSSASVSSRSPSESETSPTIDLDPGCVNQHLAFASVSDAASLARVSCSANTARARILAAASDSACYDQVGSWTTYAGRQLCVRSILRVGLCVPMWIDARALDVPPQGHFGLARDCHDPVPQLTRPANVTKTSTLKFVRITALSGLTTEPSCRADQFAFSIPGYQADVCTTRPYGAG